VDVGIVEDVADVVALAIVAGDIASSEFLTADSI